MKKLLATVVMITTLTLSLFILPQTTHAAVADGTYSVDYTVLQGGSDSVSMANDYFDKPATVTVSGGETTVDIQVNHSKWIIGLWLNSASEQVISSDKGADTRKVRFNIGTLEEQIPAKIKVDIDDNDLNYHHEYKIVLKFVLPKNTEKASGTSDSKNTDAVVAKGTDTSGSSATTSTEKVANPKSGDNSSMMLYGGLGLLALIGLVVVRKKTATK